MKNFFSAVTILFVLLVSIADVSAEAFDTLWTKIYDLGNTSRDMGTCINKTDDGGYIIFGSTDKAFSDDIFLMKIDGNGDTLWTRVFLPESGVQDFALGSQRARYVEQTTDGGYFFVSEWVTQRDPNIDYDYDFDVYFVKTDSNGDTLWTRTYGRPDICDGALSAQHTSDGGYILAGGSRYLETLADTAVYIVKTDTNGDTLWTRNFDFHVFERALSIQQTTDGGYIIGGSCNDGGYSNSYVIRINEVGDTLWTRVFDLSPDTDKCRSIRQTSDGGYILTGNFMGTFNTDVYLLKLDENGNEMWIQTYDITMSDQCVSVRQTSDGGYVLIGDVGFPTPAPGHIDGLIIKTDAEGNSLWENVYGNSSSGLDYFKSVELVELPGGGEACIVTGMFQTNLLNSDVWILRFDKITDVDNIEVNMLPSRASLSQNYPNPFNPSTKINYSLPYSSHVTIDIYDVLGRKIVTLLDKEHEAGYHQVTWNASEYPSGVYFYKLTTDDYSRTRRMALIK